MSGLCACLNDAVILVQRNTLEFLLLGFPMHTEIIRNSDLIKLVTNALNTILRRDMSLNRRLYSWLLGSEVVSANRKQQQQQQQQSGEQDSFGAITTTAAYFENYSKTILIKALRCTLKYSLQSSPVDLRPYKILISLLDKTEIGLAVLDDILCDVIRTMALSNNNLDVTKSANLLFATFDPAYIWDFMTQLYERGCVAAKANFSKSDEALQHQLFKNDVALTRFTPEVDSGQAGLIEVCYLTEFLLETISLEMYNETTRVYLPRVFLAITQMLTIYSEYLSEYDITAALKLCTKIVSRVQPMIT
jgi:Dopey, N-terminal